MKRKMHLTGGAHLDPVWLWNWREGFQANKATLKSALDRMMEFDDFVFSTTSAQFYEWLEENEPDMFRKIQARVKEGRWVICGGWWIQPDCNVPSGEALARQALLAQRYFKEKFGVTAVTGLCADSFGHNAMLPQILKKSGMDNYVFMRPQEHEMDIPARTFLWQSPDGSQVRTYRIPFNYHFGDSIKLQKTLEEFLDDLLADEHCGDGPMLAFVGTGNHGGGPTIRHITGVNAYKEANKDKVEVVWSDPDKYFAEVEDSKLPVVSTELQYHAPGCYAACSMIKDMNRKAENALVRAEKFEVIAARLGKNSHKEDMNRAWKQVLFNQFHDTLGGTATEEACIDARNQYGEAISIADRQENGAMQAMSFDIDIPYGEQVQPFVVFNPHSWDVTVPVEYEIPNFIPVRIPDEIQLLDGDGNEVAIQMTESKIKTFGSYRRIAFMAKIPALGYNAYRLQAGTVTRERTKTDVPVLENDKIRVEFDHERGTIKSIWHKELKKYIVNTPARVRVIRDMTDTWGHSLTNLDDEIGEFKNAEFFGEDTGAVRTRIRFRSYYGDSILNQTFTLYRGEDCVRVESRLNWREQHCALKLDFTANTENAKATVEIPYGCVEKKTEGHEEAMQCWCDISGSDVGLSIANNNKYSVDFRGSTVGITVLRSPVYVHHDPLELDPNDNNIYMEQGMQDFSYVVKPHAGACDPLAIRKLAMELNQPVVSQLETFHEGDLPRKKGFITVEKENILLSALKEGYDGDCTILRLHEAKGEKTTTSVTFMDTTFTAEFGAWEIKTFKLKDGKVTEVNLLEW